MEAKVNLKNKWFRILADGEILQEGDYYISNGGVWKTLDVGYPVKNDKTYLRSVTNSEILREVANELEDTDVDEVEHKIARRAKGLDALVMMRDEPGMVMAWGGWEYTHTTAGLQQRSACKLRWEPYFVVPPEDAEFVEVFLS